MQAKKYTKFGSGLGGYPAQFLSLFIDESTVSPLKQIHMKHD